MKDRFDIIENHKDRRIRREIFKRLNSLEHMEGASLFEISALMGTDYGEQIGNANVLVKGGYGLFI